MPGTPKKILRRTALGTLFLLASVFLFLWITATFGYSIQTHLISPIFGDPIERTTRRLAGRDAVDCGRVDIHGDSTSATRCSLDAQSEGRSFRVIYNRQGTDSTIADAFIRTLDGRLYRIGYDSRPQGRGFSLLRQRTYSAPCLASENFVVDPRGRLYCHFPKQVDLDGLRYGPLLLF